MRLRVTFSSLESVPDLICLAISAAFGPSGSDPCVVEIARIGDMLQRMRGENVAYFPMLV